MMYFRGSIDTLDGGMIELALDPHLNKTGDIWHICIEVPDIYPFMDFG
jgi:hypothetical protein